MLILFLGIVSRLLFWNPVIFSDAFRIDFSASFLEPGYIFRTHFGLLSRLLFWNPVMFFGTRFRLLSRPLFWNPVMFFGTRSRLLSRLLFWNPVMFFGALVYFFGMYVERVMSSNTICSL
jgi:hypothetical protein